MTSLNKKETLAVMWALIESEPGLCFVPDHWSPVHIAMLNDLPASDLQDFEVTNMFRKLAEGFLS